MFIKIEGQTHVFTQRATETRTEVGALRNAMWLKEIGPKEYTLHFHDVLLQTKLNYSLENPEHALTLRGRKGAGADGEAGVWRNFLEWQ